MSLPLIILNRSCLESILVESSRRLLTSATTSSAVEIPRSACKRISCRSSKTSSGETPVYKDSMFISRRLRLLARPSAKALFVCVVYADASESPFPSSPRFAAPARLPSWSRPSCERSRKKSNTMDSSVEVEAVKAVGRLYPYGTKASHCGRSNTEHPTKKERSPIIAFDCRLGLSFRLCSILAVAVVGLAHNSFST
jgi:hypothetical protein